MSKKTGKAKETIIMIRIPDAQARRGDASLTVQRGDLGSVQQFAYTGLTLSGNIAQAVQTAFVTLAKLEATSPPVFAEHPGTSTSTDAQPEPLDDEVEVTEPDASDLTDNTDSADTEDNLVLEEAPAEEPEVPDIELMEAVIVPTITPVAATSTSIAATLPVNQSQMSLF